MVISQYIDYVTKTQISMWPGKRLRIFHGPVNIAGIGRHLADWQRKQGAISDFIVFRDHTMAQNNHLNLHLEKYKRFFRLFILFAFFIRCIVRYDLFHFYFGKSLLPFNLDLPILKLFRKKIIMTYCGSDIRLAEVENHRNPYYKFLRVAKVHPKWDKMKKRRMLWHRLWVDRFTAIRNLYAHAIEVIPKDRIIKDLWLNNTMDIKAYYPSFNTKDIPVLVHAPSSPSKKGSAQVDKAISDLNADGYKFKYARLEEVPNDEAQRIYREEADIIIDQLYLGSFGSLAVEGMYYGKPVCCFIIDEILQELPDCPIVNCTIYNLKEKLAWLIDHPEERTILGKKGRAFVEKYCDREAINRRLWAVYEELVQR